MSKVVDLNERRNQGRTNKLRNVRPGRPKNIDLRSREYLLPSEVERLVLQAGKIGPHRHREKCLLLTAYRHGLRVSELVNLFWNQIDFQATSLIGHATQPSKPSATNGIETLVTTSKKAFSTFLP